MAGLSKGMSLEDIAKKHKVDIDVLKKELKTGIEKEEEEHTSDVKKATRIAMDHLFEDPKYYTKLAKLNLEIKVKIYPGGQGADVDYDEVEFGKMPTSDIPLDMLLLNEPASKMLEPKSKATLKDLIKAIKAGKELPPIIVRELGNKYQIVDGHHRYFAHKLLGKDKIKAVIVDPQDVEILKENLNKSLVSEFMKHVMDELHLEKLPKITLSNDSQEAIDLRSWGGYRPSTKSIHIITAKRHPADIFRTLAHELVHYKQDLESRLKPESGKTGSDDENEANSRAAVIMRNFAQAKPNLFEHLTKEGEYGDYLFGDKESGVKIGWYKDEVEVDTPAEKLLFNFLKKYADSEANVYSTVNLDPYLEIFKKLKTEYPEIVDSNLSPNTYIYRGTVISEEKAAALFNSSNKEETKDNIIIPNQEYSSRRKISSWSTRYFPAASFAMSTAERGGEGVPVVMRAKAEDAELFFNPKFMDKLSDQFEDEVINAANPIKVDIMLIKNYEDEFEDIESGYLSTK
jgi:uncharacterized ParB-like nuclease family protein